MTKMVKPCKCGVPVWPVSVPITPYLQTVSSRWSSVILLNSSSV
nr:hypothetical protein [Circovirus sp.]